MPEFPDRQLHHLRWFDQNSAQVYSVTICTHDRIHFFGRIRNELMYLNETGRLSRSRWISLPDRFPGIQLGNFVFMPNHFHGLITIYKQTNLKNMPERFHAHKQEMMAEHNPHLKNIYNPPRIGEIIRTFKAVSTRRIHVLGEQNFAWQENYWEEAIRNKKRFYVVCNYIRENPRRWEKDKFYKSET